MSNFFYVQKGQLFRCWRTLLGCCRKLMRICCQFCLIFIERNHGHPNSRGYALCASKGKTTIDFLNAWPPTTIPNFRSNPKGWTNLVSTMQSQNEQASQVAIPKRLQVSLLMTFTPDPSSIMHPDISSPLMMNFMAGLWWSMTIGLATDSMKCVAMANGSSLSVLASTDCLDYRTSFSNLFIDTMIW